jgi:hypothetical protein
VKNQRPETIQVIMLREASKVERCHTIPHHGSYTDGQHSYDAAMMYLTLCPAPSFKVVKAILSHDLGERWVGDVPAPTKWADGEMSKRLQTLEDRCLRRMGVAFQLEPEDQKWLKAMDMLELWIWGHEQMAMGNANAATIVGNLNAHFMRIHLPDEVVNFLKDYQWTRTPDEIPK